MVTFTTLALLYLSTDVLCLPLPDIINGSSLQRVITNSETNKTSLPVSPSITTPSEFEITNTNFSKSPVSTTEPPLLLPSVNNIALIPTIEISMISTETLSSSSENHTERPLTEVADVTTTANLTNMKESSSIPSCSIEKPSVLQVSNNFLTPSTPTSDLSSQTNANSATLIQTSQASSSTTSSPLETTDTSLTARDITGAPSIPQQQSTANNDVISSTPSISSTPRSPRILEPPIPIPITPCNSAQTSTLPQFVNITILPSITKNSTASSPLLQLTDNTTASFSVGNLTEITSPLKKSKAIILSTTPDNLSDANSLPQIENTIVVRSDNLTQTTSLPHITSLPQISNSIIVTPRIGNMVETSSLPQPTHSNTLQFLAVNLTKTPPSPPTTFTPISPTVTTLPKTNITNVPFVPNCSISTLSLPQIINVSSAVTPSTHQIVDVTIASPVPNHSTEAILSPQTVVTTIAPSKPDNYSTTASPLKTINATTSSFILDCLRVKSPLPQMARDGRASSTPEQSSKSPSLLQTIPASTTISPTANLSTETTLLPQIAYTTSLSIPESPCKTSCLTQSPDTSVISYTTENSSKVSFKMQPSNNTTTEPSISRSSNTKLPSIPKNVNSSSEQPTSNITKLPCLSENSNNSLLPPLIGYYYPTTTPRSFGAFRPLTPIQLVASAAATSNSYAERFRPSRAVATITQQILTPTFDVIPPNHRVLLGLHQTQR